MPYAWLVQKNLWPHDLQSKTKWEPAGASCPTPPQGVGQTVGIIMWQVVQMSDITKI